jgi:hypothetical protein
MQIDPAFEFRRLAEEYRAKTDDELVELATDFADLTEPAQQALRQEMQSRRLRDPRAASTENNAQAGPQTTNAQPQTAYNMSDIREPVLIPTDSVLGRSPKVVPDEPDSNSDEDTSDLREYTWKTVLCECETTDQVQELAEALRKAGLDSWIQGSHEYGRRYAQVLVAADQLDRAREIAAQPIPPQILDESREEVPEFTPPVCPKCGAGDPVLEGVDPQNTWRCDQCGEQWADPAEVQEEKAVKSGDLPA